MVRKKKTARRGKGEGAIYQRKDGRWASGIEIEGENKRTRKYFYGETRQEVQDKLDNARYEQKQGRLATGPKQTVKHFLEDWLEKVHKHKIRLNSYAFYRSLLDHHILPAIGHVQLQKLTAHQIEILYAQKKGEGYAAETIRAMHRMLHKAFDDAVRWKLLSFNVCDHVDQPRAVKIDIHTLTMEQAKTLIEAARGHHLEVLVTLALATGMRRGELLALKWEDINFEERTLHIKRTVNRVKHKGMVESEPKTAKSKSIIPLPQFAIDALTLQRTRQADMRTRAGTLWQDYHLAFCTRTGGFIRPQNLHESFKRLLKKAGLPDMRFHDLRHSVATILLEMNVHPKLVQELLRHSNIAITMDRYSHVLPSMQRKMMDDLDTFFGK